LPRSPSLVGELKHAPQGRWNSCPLFGGHRHAPQLPCCPCAWLLLYWELPPSLARAYRSEHSICCAPEADAYPSLGNALVGLTPWQGRLFTGTATGFSFTVSRDFAIRAFDPETGRLVEEVVPGAEGIWDYRSSETSCSPHYRSHGRHPLCGRRAVGKPRRRTRNKAHVRHGCPRQRLVHGGIDGSRRRGVEKRRRRSELAGVASCFEARSQRRRNTLQLRHGPRGQALCASLWGWAQRGACRYERLRRHKLDRRT